MGKVELRSCPWKGIHCNWVLPSRRHDGKQEDRSRQVSLFRRTYGVGDRNGVENGKGDEDGKGEAKAGLLALKK